MILSGTPRYRFRSAAGQTQVEAGIIDQHDGGGSEPLDLGESPVELPPEVPVLLEHFPTARPRPPPRSSPPCSPRRPRASGGPPRPWNSNPGCRGAQGPQQRRAVRVAADLTGHEVEGGGVASHQDSRFKNQDSRKIQEPRFKEDSRTKVQDSGWNRRLKFSWHSWRHLRCLRHLRLKPVFCDNFRVIIPPRLFES